MFAFSVATPLLIKYIRQHYRCLTTNSTTSINKSNQQNNSVITSTNSQSPPSKHEIKNAKSIIDKIENIIHRDEGIYIILSTHQ
jgi:hypothetical protein